MVLCTINTMTNFKKRLFCQWNGWMDVLFLYIINETAHGETLLVQWCFISNIKHLTSFLELKLDFVHSYQNKNICIKQHIDAFNLWSSVQQQTWRWIGNVHNMMAAFFPGSLYMASHKKHDKLKYKTIKHKFQQINQKGRLTSEGCKGHWIRCKYPIIHHLSEERFLPSWHSFGKS